MKDSKKIILGSLMIALLSGTVVIGSTYALFTDEASTNIALSNGSVDYEATIEDLVVYSPYLIGLDGTIVDDTNVASGTTFYNGGTVNLTDGDLSLSNMTAGDKVTFKIDVTNNSNVLSKHQTIIQTANDTGLLAGLVIKINDKVYSGNTIESDWSETQVGVDPTDYEISIELPSTASNIYQGKKVDLSFAVKAIQANALVKDPSLGPDVIDIYTLDELKAFAEDVNNGNSYAGKLVRLKYNINLKNEEWIPIGTSEKPFKGSFDGLGHTISNLYINKSPINDSYHNRHGLFGTVVPSGETYIKNLTLHNINVTAGYHTGGLIGAADGSGQTATGNYLSVTDINVTGKVIVEGYEGVGAVMGSGNMYEMSNININADDGSYVSNTVGGRVNAFTVVGSVKGGGYLSKIDNITSNLDVKSLTAGAGGLFGVIGGSGVKCYVSNLNYTGTLTMTATSVDTQWNIPCYSYNGLLIGSPRFNLIADEATCVSTGTLALHTEEGIKTSNDMDEYYTFGVDLFGASRDNSYTNKSYSKTYAG